MKNNMTLFTDIFVKTVEAKKSGSPFSFFRPHEPNILTGLAHVWLRGEPNILRLKHKVWLMSGSLKPNQNEKYGSWLNVYIYMSQ